MTIPPTPGMPSWLRSLATLSGANRSTLGRDFSEARKFLLEVGYSEYYVDSELSWEAAIERARELRRRQEAGEDINDWRH